MQQYSCLSSANYSRKLFYILFVALFAAQLHLAADYKKPAHIEEKTWEKVKPYLIPENHPAKKKLDEIFAKGRPLASSEALHVAGFTSTKPRKFTRVIVTGHPKLSGYLIKAYTDSQHYHKSKPEWMIWLLRIWGAELIRQEIASRGWQHWFSVPKKWIYMVPHPERYKGGKPRKDFILVVEDMKLARDSKNEKMWASSAVTKERLTAFFNIVTRLGLWDCAKIANAPFTESGKITFIDTESFARWPVFYEKLTQNLSHSMREVWNGLAGDSASTERSHRARELRRQLP